MEIPYPLLFATTQSATVTSIEPVPWTPMPWMLPDATVPLIEVFVPSWMNRPLLFPTSVQRSTATWRIPVENTRMPWSLSRAVVSATKRRPPDQPTAETASVKPLIVQLSTWT